MHIREVNENVPGMMHPRVQGHFANTLTRCSREDYAVLESEYQRNPRPDKETRMSIVERVSLSEKAVQVCPSTRWRCRRQHVVICVSKFVLIGCAGVVPEQKTDDTPQMPHVAAK